MLILLSPAKNLDYDSKLTTQQHTQPDFIPEAQALIAQLKQLSVQDVAELMHLSDKLAALNVARYASWEPSFTTANSRPAALAFNGDVYAGLDAKSLDEDALAFAQRHIRILSGLYGVLRPLDLMQPYRLEMGTRLANSKGKDLYSYWGEQITTWLNNELAQQAEDTVINLASNEYFKAVKPQKLNANLITPIFKDYKNGQYKIISFYAKKARGLMSRYVIDKRIEHPDGLKDFDYEDYQFNPELTQGNSWVFTRDSLNS